MTWNEAKQHAARLFDAVGRRHASEGRAWPECLRGADVPLADYQDEADYRLLKPGEGWSLHDHRLVNRAFSRLVARHGGKPRFVVLRTVDYLRWLAANGLKNDTVSRARYIAEASSPP